MRKGRVRCECCGELVERDRVWPGDEGTHYEGKPVCERCWDSDFDDAPCATVYYGRPDPDDGYDTDQVCRIGAIRNETEGVFRVKWVPTDPWRGYYEVESDYYVQVFTDSILSGHESEAMLKELHDRALERFELAGIDFVRVFCRSSNLFCTHFDLWVKREQVLKAHMILAGIKQEVDFDNPLYSTGILFPRESLERFKSLLGAKYSVTTDKDLADLVAEKGDELLREIAGAGVRGGN